MERKELVKRRRTVLLAITLFSIVMVAFAWVGMQLFPDLGQLPLALGMLGALLFSAFASGHLTEKKRTSLKVPASGHLTEKKRTSLKVPGYCARCGYHKGDHKEGRFCLASGGQYYLYDQTFKDQVNPNTRL